MDLSGGPLRNFPADWCHAEALEAMFECSPGELCLLVHEAKLLVARVTSLALKQPLPGFWIHIPALRFQLTEIGPHTFEARYRTKNQPLGYETIPLASKLTKASKAQIRAWVEQGKVTPTPRVPGSGAERPQVLVCMKDVRDQVARKGKRSR